MSERAELGSVSLLYVITTLNVIPTVNVIHFNAKCNTNRIGKCNKHNAKCNKLPNRKCNTT